jgi:hypothetical protein
VGEQSGFAAPCQSRSRHVNLSGGDILGKPIRGNVPAHQKAATSGPLPGAVRHVIQELGHFAEAAFYFAAEADSSFGAVSSASTAKLTFALLSFSNSSVPATIVSSTKALVTLPNRI